MSFAYLPLYTGDYLRDTRHLSPLKHGIYLLLLMHCWDQRGPLPLDEQECAGIANCRSGDEIESLRYVLSKFFVGMADGHYNRRMQGEIERAETISRERSEAGRKGYQAKAKHLLSKSQASATIPTTTTIPPPTPAPVNQAKSTSGAARATRLPPDWQLPDDWKAWAVKVHHLEPQRAVRVSLAFRDYWIALAGTKACKLDWFATWRNWIRKETQDA